MINLTSDAAIMFGLALVSFLLSIALLVSWRTLGGDRHALIWSCAFGIAAAQWATIGGYNSYFESTTMAVVGATWAGAVVAILMVVGFRERMGLPRHAPLAAVAIVASGLLIYFPYVADRAQISLAVPQFTRTLLLPIAAWPMLRRRPRPDIAEMMVSGVLLAFAAFSAVVGYLRLIDCGCETNEARVVLLVGLPVLFTGLGIAIIHLLASDLAVQLRVAARVDPLTDALNRRGFEEAFSHLMARRRLARNGHMLVLIDLDHFKPINDRFGHACGDEVLQGVADRVRKCIRGDDLFARLGGDEFALLLDATHPDIALEVTEQIRSGLRALDNLPDGSRITASFGIARVADRDELPAAYREADRALYQAKSSGRDGVHQAWQGAEEATGLTLSPAVS